MAVAVKAKPMARKKSEGEGPPTIAVKIDKVLAARAKVLAADRGLDLAEYLSELLRSPIDRDWAKMVKRMGGGGDQ